MNHWMFLAQYEKQRMFIREDPAHKSRDVKVITGYSPTLRLQSWESQHNFA